MKDLLKRTLGIALTAMLLFSCKIEEDPVPDPQIVIDPPCVPYKDVTILSDWTLKAGDTFVLRHTPGLKSMALSGSHSTLSIETCGIGFPATIPSGLEDDEEGDGYASQRQYEDIIVAMYHPTTYPDHFITYNTVDGSWIRWDLSDGPGIFRQSE